MSLRARLVLVVSIVVALVVAVNVTTVSPAPTAAPWRGPRLAASGAATTWYCAEGTANAGGRADEQILVGNVDRHVTRATITVDGGAGIAPVSRTVTVGPGAVVRVPVSTIAPIAEPGVVVETTGGRAAVSHRITSGSEDALGPCAREPATVTRFAAGTTNKGAQLWLAVFNPFPDDAIVDVTALTPSGLRAPGSLQGLVVPRTSRVSIPIHDAIPRVDTVAIQVTVRRGRAVVEISQRLDGSDGRTGVALSLGSSAARSWRFPIAVTGSGRQERLVLANPFGQDAAVTVRTALDAAAAVEPGRISVAAGSVVTADLGVPADIGFSITVRSTRAVVAEMVGASGAPQPAEARGIASDLGITHGADTWAVVPARLDPGSTDLLAVVSADGRAHRVRLVRVRAGAVLAEVRVPAIGRVLVDLAKTKAVADDALLVRADGPVMVERQSTGPGLTRSHAIPG